MQRPELRPLGVGETVDVSLKLYLRHAGTLLGIAAVMIIPVYIVFNLILISMAPDEAVVRDGLILMPLQSDADAFNRVLLGFVLLSVVAAMLATGAAFKAVADAYLGDKPSIGDSLRFAGRRLHSLIWLSVLYAILVVIGLIAWSSRVFTWPLPSVWRCRSSFSRGIREAKLSDAHEIWSRIVGGRRSALSSSASF